MSPAERWMHEMLQNGAFPEIEVLQVGAQWNASEAAWIERLSEIGHRLLNVQSRI
jgi:hypothetical protein